MEQIPESEVAIIGAGPIGLELAVGLKQIGVEFLHFEAEQIGHTISWFPRQARFFSTPERIAICGVPLQTTDQSKATREEYLAYLRSIVEQFQLTVRTYERIKSIESGSKGFDLVSERISGGCSRSRVKNVILAVGDMARPRRLDIPGEDLPHVSHYFDEPHKYFRKRLLIVGGKNSAVEAAIRCHRAGAKVSISYRRERFDPDSIKYWLLPEIEMLIRSGKIAFHPDTRPVQITAGGVILESAGKGQQVEEPVDFVLAMTGYVADTTLFETVGAQVEAETLAPVHDQETMETTVPGVYVAGTAAAGSQVNYRLFIENCHAHVAKIIKAITGQTIAPSFINPLAIEGLPES